MQLSSQALIYEFLIDTLLVNTNCLIVTYPGFGISHILNSINQQNIYKIITSPDQELSSHNILDLDSKRNELFTESIDKIFKKKYDTSTTPYFCVVINTPKLLKEEKYINSYFSKHVYKTLFLPPFTYSDTQRILEEDLKINLTQQQILKFQEFSAGSATLIKYFAKNIDLLNQNPSDLVKKIELQNKFFPLISEILATPIEIKEKLPVSSELVDTLLQKPDLFQTQPLLLPVQIREDGMVYLQQKILTQLTKLEAQILDFTLNNKLIITRDQIAKIKWQNQFLEKYSDQAITTTIKRINEKLKQLKFTSISGVGYRLNYAHKHI